MFTPESNRKKKTTKTTLIIRKNKPEQHQGFVLLILYLWQDQFASSMLLEKAFHYLFTMPVLKGLSHFSQLKV